MSCQRILRIAVVLARTIDAVKADPQQQQRGLRAWHKLQQLSDDDPPEKARLMHALEVAIVGVEARIKDSSIRMRRLWSAT
jgi:hypothetical protein